MTRPSGAPKPLPKRGLSKRALIVLEVIGGLVAVFLIGWAGWGIHAATHPAKSVRVSSVFTGTVSLVGNGGSSGCVQPDSGGKPVCSSFSVEAGAPALKVGQKVHVAQEWTPVDGGGSQNLLVVFSPKVS